jgi:hypothetical protein
VDRDIHLSICIGNLKQIKMYTKTWKIGEVCQGGIITAETTTKYQLLVSEWILKKWY